jgi:hypothetical protein
VTDTLLTEALHVIGLAINSCEESPPQPSGTSPWDKLSAQCCRESEAGLSVAELLVKLLQCNKAMISSCRYQYVVHKPALERIIEHLCRGSEACAHVIQPLMSTSSGEGGADGAGAEEESEERTRRQKEARDRALAQMAAQQVCFCGCDVCVCWGGGG